MQTLEFCAAPTFHRSTFDDLKSILGVCFPKVQHNLPRLFHVQRTWKRHSPRDQTAHLTLVVFLISVADKTHYGSVAHKHNEEVGLGSECGISS